MSPATDQPQRARARRQRFAIACVLALLTTTLLSLGHRQVGYVRDEGVYFVAGRVYAAWVSDALAGRNNARTQAARDRAFALNREHPALMKTAAGVSARMFAKPAIAPKSTPDAVTREPSGLWPLMAEGAAMRLPAQALAGALVGLLFLLGARVGRSRLAGILVAVGFISLPRVWFHAGLHCFDIPVVFAGVVCTYIYFRSLRDPRYGWALGPALGVAIAIKHNALFLPFLFGLHHLICMGIEIAKAPHLRDRKLWARVFSLPFVNMLLVAPLTALALWPWMWADTWQRLQEYFAFHLHHSWYNMEYLGVNYNKPPLPVDLPVVLTWATVPSCLLVLACIGCVLLLVRDVRLARAQAKPNANEHTIGQLFLAPHRGFVGDGLGSLLLLSAVFPIALISSPNVPVFGGTKHWLLAYPFLLLAAAYAWRVLWSKAELGPRVRHAPALALLVVLVPGIWSTAHGHPHNLSQYAPAVGGARGAAQLGLGRGFWGYAVTPLLPNMQQPTGSMYLHDLHELVRRQYVREGVLPPGLEAATPRRADQALMFYERHMLTNEIDVWNGLGTTSPSAVVTLDDVPLTGLYTRPSRRP